MNTIQYNTIQYSSNTGLKRKLEAQATLCEKYPNTEFFSGPYFPVLGLIRENLDQKKKLRI